MKRARLPIVVLLAILPRSPGAEASYFFGEGRQRRLTIVGTQVVVDSAPTVWHGKRGGVLFAFHEGRRWYLTADRKGNVFVTDNRQNALQWEFAETKSPLATVKPGHEPPDRRTFNLPEVSSSIATRGLDGKLRALVVVKDEVVRDSQGKPVSGASAVRLARVGPPGPDGTPTTFTIQGTDSKFVKDKPDDSSQQNSGKPGIPSLNEVL